MRRWRRQNHSVLDTTSMLLLMILVVSGSWLVAPYFQLGSFSYFSDQEWAEATFTAGQWVVGVGIDIKPDTLNLGSQGRWITVYANITVFKDYKAGDVDGSTVLLEGIIPINRSDVQDENLFMAKFNRASVIDLIGEGHEGDDMVTLTVTGQFKDGMSFQGNDTISLE